MKTVQKMAAGVAMMVGVALGVAGALPVMAVDCPAGSERASADSYAECNIPVSATQESVWDVVQRIINLVIGVLGVVTVVVIVLGGVMYATSSGEAANVKRAKDMIMYGVIGLVIALLAYAIVNFVLSNVFGG